MARPATDYCRKSEQFTNDTARQEYAFLIEEVPCLREGHEGADLLSLYQPAIDAYRKARREHLRLFPGVRETLLALRERGCLIIDHTESMAFYSNDRLRRLGLDGLLDVLYSPRDHDLPTNMTPETLRKYPASHYELIDTVHRYTPDGETKPNPQLLLDILKEIGADPTEALYVGDSEMKDVVMAQAAG